MTSSSSTSTSSSIAAITAAEVMRSDCFDIFNITSFQTIQSIVDSNGRLQAETLSAVDRLGRRLALRFHPDRNPDGREPFEKVRQCVEQLKDAEQLVRLAATKIGATAGQTQRSEVAAQAHALGAKLAKRMAAEAELKRQKQQRDKVELERNLRGMAAASSSSSSSSSSGAIATSVADMMLSSGAAYEQSVLERERKAQMSDWERMEEEMLSEWDVDAEMLRRKEAEVSAKMRVLRREAVGRGGGGGGGRSGWRCCCRGGRRRDAKPTRT